MVRCDRFSVGPELNDWITQCPWKETSTSGSMITFHTDSLSYHEQSMINVSFGFLFVANISTFLQLLQPTKRPHLNGNGGKLEFVGVATVDSKGMCQLYRTLKDKEKDKTVTWLSHCLAFVPSTVSGCNNIVNITHKTDLFHSLLLAPDKSQSIKEQLTYNSIQVGNSRFKFLLPIGTGISNRSIGNITMIVDLVVLRFFYRW